MLLFSGPIVPRFRFLILFHQRPKERVVVEPGRFAVAKILKSRSSALVGVRRKLRKRPLEQIPFQFLYALILHRAVTKFGWIKISKRSFKIIPGQIFWRTRREM